MNTRWLGLIICATACSSGSQRVDRAAEVRVERVREVSGTPLSLRRLDPHPGETLVAHRADGAEVSWRFDEKPARVQVELAVPGARYVGVDADGLHFDVPTADGVRKYRFGHATFIDANGVRTDVPARFVADVGAERIVLAVDDAVVAKAAYPAVLDPTIAAEFEISAPTMVELPGTSEPASILGAGANRVLFARASLGDIRHTRVLALPTTVDALVVPKILFDLRVHTVVDNGTQTLVVGTARDKVVFVRLAADGTRLDATPVIVGDGSVTGAAWDGTQWVLVWRTRGEVLETTRGAHVTTAGVSTGFEFVIAAFNGEPTDVACVGATCLAPGAIATYRIGPSGVTGQTDPLYQARLFAGASEFFAIGGTESEVLSLGWVTSSGTGVLGADLAGQVASAPFAVSAALDATGATMAFRHRQGGLYAGRVLRNVTTPAWLTKVSESSGGAPRVAMDGARATLVWPDASQKLVFAQFDAATSPGTLSAPLAKTLGRSAPAQYEAALASDGKDFLVAWTEERGTTFEVRARKVSATGTPLDVDRVLATANTGRFGRPAVTWDGTRFVVAFRRFEAIGFAVPSVLQLVRVAADGAPVDTTPKDVDADGGVHAQGPVLASAAGSTIVAWIDATALRVRRIDASGAFVDPTPLQLALADVKGVANNEVAIAPAIASDGKRFLVTWPLISDESRDVLGAIVEPTGPLPKTSLPIAALAGYQQNPGVAWDGERYLVAWTEQRQGASFAVRAVRVDATGKALDASPVTVLTDVCDTCAPSIAFDGATFVVAALGASVVPEREIVLARVRRDGVVVPEAPWSMTKTALTPFAAFVPALASDGKGTSFVAASTLASDAQNATVRLRLRSFVAKAPIGGACTETAGCDAGTCVDGICCKTACAGTCEACDVPGSLGDCVPVRGKPHSARTCGGSATDACAQGACDGSEAAKCTSFVLPTGGTCAAPRCDGTRYVASALCSETRSCVVPAPAECAPYRCSPSGCSKTCASDEECSAPARCIASSCVPSTTGARCTDDRLSSIPKDGTAQSCAPFKCNTDGLCASTCINSDECILGYTCDVSSSRCVLPELAQVEEGGCAMSSHVRSERAGYGGAFFALAAVLVAARRRRARLSVWASLSASVAAVSAGGCRAADPPAPPALAQTSSALTVSAESTSVDAVTTPLEPRLSSAACNANGCLVAHYEDPWLVGTRLDATGALATPSSVLIGPSFRLLSDDYTAYVTAVATDGTNYLVAWNSGRDGEGYAQNYAVRIGPDGKALDAPTRFVTSTAFSMKSLTASWDGKSYLVAWQQSRGSFEVSNVWGARIAADGTRLDPNGFPLITVASSDPKEASIGRPVLSCDGAGCLVAAPIEAFNPTGVTPSFPTVSSRIVRVVDGAISAGPATAALPITGLARAGTQWVATGGDAAGVHALLLGADGSPTTTRARLGSTEEIVRVVASGADLVAVASSPGFFNDTNGVSLYRFSPSLTLLEGPVTGGAGSQVASLSSIGSIVIAATGDGAYRVKPAPLAEERIVGGARGFGHTWVRSAKSDSGQRLLAWGTVQQINPAGSSKFVVSVAKVDDTGALTPAGGTVVAEESPSLAGDVAVSWDGTRFVVAWMSEQSPNSMIGAARVDVAGALIDKATVYTRPSGDNRFYRAVHLASDATGTTLLTSEASLGAYSTSAFLLGADGRAVAAPPARLAIASRSDDLATLRIGTSTLVAYVTNDTRELMIARLAGDGTQVGASKTVVAATGRRAHPSLAFDGTKLHLVYADERPDGLLSDIWVASFLPDLSDLPATPFLVSARDPAQRRPAIALDGTRAVVTFREEASAAATESVRASWIDLATKTVLVDAAPLFTFGNGELSPFDRNDGDVAEEQIELTTIGPNRYGITYARRDADPKILAARAKSRVFSFGALGTAACTSNADCENGACSDGVCCDRACDGPCEACNEPGKQGICTTVAGAPRATRTCAAASATCGESTCDGFDATRCARFTKGFETSCATATCADAIFTGPGFCSGTGACAVPEKTSCAPYLCDPNGCLSSCSTDASCAQGFACKDGACVAKELTATCTPDSLSSRGADEVEKSCAPFRCGPAGTCLTRCESSVDCGPGLSCDVAGGTCVGVAPSGDEGGCNTSRRAPPGGGGAGTAVFAALAVALWSGSRRWSKSGRG